MKKIIIIIASIVFWGTGIPVASASEDSDSLTIAKKYIGTPYCWGGESVSCFDCSGFVQYVYNKNGIQILRTADQQYRSATIIPRIKAQEGDLVFFTKHGYAYHVGIYMGNNKILHSPKPGAKVRIDSLWGSNFTFGSIY
jgi:cell wall-associated NlpC family hydrolase